MLDSALELAKKGYKIFPLSPLSKIPRAGSKGSKDATCDETVILSLWAAQSQANIALALGETSRIVAVDCDFNHGFKKEELQKFPRTITVQTKNGFHLYYKYKAGLKSRALWGGTTNSSSAYLRVNGLYTVAPPSSVKYETGEVWEYMYLEDPGGELSFSDMEPAEVPDWFFENCGANSYKPGERHDALLRTATAMRKKGKSAQDMMHALIEKNETSFIEPKKNIEVEAGKIVEWVMANVEPGKFSDFAELKKQEHYVMPLGYKEGKYFYTSSGNKEIVTLPTHNHNSLNLLGLMPINWWEDNYGKPYGKDGLQIRIDWTQAASDMMQTCRDRG